MHMDGYPVYLRCSYSSYTVAGRYFYADSSNHADGDKARLESVMIESSRPGYQQKKTFTFWYHMRGGNVRTLSVFTRDDMVSHIL